MDSMSRHLKSISSRDQHSRIEQLATKRYRFMYNDEDHHADAMRWIEPLGWCRNQCSVITFSLRSLISFSRPCLLLFSASSFVGYVWVESVNHRPSGRFKAYAAPSFKDDCDNAVHFMLCNWLLNLVAVIIHQMIILTHKFERN